MPIYEFACPKCRLVFSFLSKRIRPSHAPTCPKCGNKKLAKEISRFAAIKHSGKSSDAGEDAGADSNELGGPDLDNPRFQQAMGELERDMAHLDENNPKHVAHLMRKMKDIMPPGTAPKELDTAIKRLESGEDPESIEADMGDILGDLMGGPDGAAGSSRGGGGVYARDPGLYDY